MYLPWPAFSLRVREFVNVPCRGEDSEINIYRVSPLQYSATHASSPPPSPTERSYRTCTTPKVSLPTTSHHLQPGLLTPRSIRTPSDPAKPGAFAPPSISTIASPTV